MNDARGLATCKHRYRGYERLIFALAVFPAEGCRGGNWSALNTGRGQVSQATKP